MHSDILPKSTVSKEIRKDWFHSRETWHTLPQPGGQGQLSILLSHIHSIYPWYDENQTWGDENGTLPL